MQVVWYKRDLRVMDHQPLREAAQRGGRLVCLYVYEPIVYGAETADALHLNFVNESLRDLDAALRMLGGELTIRHGSMPHVLRALEEEAGEPIAGLWSHQETGEMVTYQRDLAVAEWCRENGVPWREFPLFGVQRGRCSRDGWARHWQAMMDHPMTATPVALGRHPRVAPGGLRTAAELGVASASRRMYVQAGGLLAAGACLDSFLTERGVDYRTGMSSPLSAWEACSRLSPHLAYGTVSIRAVHQATRARQAALKADPERDPRWLKSLSSFQGRLRWHCHFIQKLEDEPELETRNMCRIYDGMRETNFDAARFSAWCKGETGYPMVDACMRALQQSGWINFRMRAMLVSFASYHLWLDWRPTSRFLARHFLDYEPGIHYSQFQMQSGVTGINAVRIYSPAKQALDQDPDGTFIRRHVPELAAVPAEFLAEPEKMPVTIQKACGVRIGRDYPLPIVDHRQAVQAATRAIYSLRKTAAARSEAQEVYQRHGSRRRPRR